MDYKTFFQRFGGSARRNHVKSILRPIKTRTKRTFRRLPYHSEIPKDFIRLCPWEMEYVFAVARRARRGILEIGRLKGGSTFLLACANEDVPIWSIDINPKDDQRLTGLFSKCAVGQNVNLIVGDSRTDLPQLGMFDVIFIDGDHTYDGCYADMATWYPHLVAGGDLLLHDSYLGRLGVQDAILDFMEQHSDLDIVASPIIGATYWHFPVGSVAHLRKKKQAAPADSVEPLTATG